MPTTVTLLGTTCRLYTREEIDAAITQASTTNPVRVSTPNPEHLLEAMTHSAFRNAVQSMTHHILDGFGLYLAIKLGHPSIPLDHYSGADLVHDLFTRYQDGTKRFYFLGGLENVAVTAKQEVERRFPGIRIVGAESGGVIDRVQPTLDPDLVARLTKAQPDILIVGFGAPKQELWMQVAAELSIPAMVGVGGALAFYGTKSRAPRLVQTLKLEAFYRALTEKGHWRRLWRAVVVFPVLTLGWYLKLVQ